MIIHEEQDKEVGSIKDFIKRIIEWYRVFKIRADEVLNGTKAECCIPFSELEIMARRFLPDITSFFEKDENKQRYEKWKEENVETAYLTKPTD